MNTDVAMPKFQSEKKVSLYRPAIFEGKKVPLWDFRVQLELEAKVALGKEQYDYYAANPDAIPEDWQRKYIVFFNYIRRTGADRLIVYYLNCNSYAFHASDFSLSDSVDSYWMAAVES